MLILESPKPPPDLVIKAEGVTFNSSGNSCEPKFSTANLVDTDEIAAGVFLSTP